MISNITKHMEKESNVSQQTHHGNWPYMWKRQQKPEISSLPGEYKLSSQDVKAGENLLKISIFHKVCIVREGDTFHFKDKRQAVGNNEQPESIVKPQCSFLSLQFKDHLLSAKHTRLCRCEGKFGTVAQGPQTNIIGLWYSCFIQSTNIY